jgi:hypothetical protein
MNSAVTDSVVEDTTLAWQERMGYAVPHGPAIEAVEPGAERCDPKYRNVILERRLRQPVKQIQALRQESRILAALRDTLLPKLISGELRVRDGERIVEIV